MPFAASRAVARTFRWLGQSSARPARSASRSSMSPSAHPARRAPAAACFAGFGRHELLGRGLGSASGWGRSSFAAVGATFGASGTVGARRRRRASPSGGGTNFFGLGPHSRQLRFAAAATFGASGTAAARRLPAAIPSAAARTFGCGPGSDSGCGRSSFADVGATFGASGTAGAARLPLRFLRRHELLRLRLGQRVRLRQFHLGRRRRHLRRIRQRLRRKELRGSLPAAARTASPPALSGGGSFGTAKANRFGACTSRSSCFGGAGRYTICFAFFACGGLETIVCCRVLRLACAAAATCRAAPAAKPAAACPGSCTRPASSRCRRSTAGR